MCDIVLYTQSPAPFPYKYVRCSASAMRACAAVLLLATCAALDLRRLREATPAAVTTERFESFASPLAPGSTFLPLCGNGVVNSAQDYENYFAAGGDEHFVASVGVPVRIILSEVCDDGNRLDGDGCSADCLTLDSFVGACEVEMADDLSVLDMAIDSATGDVYVVSPTGLHIAEINAHARRVEFRAVHHARELSNVGFVANGTMLLYSPTTATVYEWKDASMREYARSAVGGEFGLRARFFSFAGVRRMLVQNGTAVCHMDLDAVVETCFAVPNLAPVLDSGYVLVPPQKTMIMRTQSNMQILVQLDPLQVSVDSRLFGTAVVSGELWADLLNFAVAPSITIEFSQMDMAFKVFGGTMGVPILAAQYGSQVSVIGPSVLFTSYSYLRNILLDTPVPASGPSVGYLALVRMFQGDLSAQYCSAASTCVLDMPLSYDVFVSQSDALAKPSLLDIATSVAAPLADDDTGADSVAYLSMLRNVSSAVVTALVPKLMQRMETHPRTGGWFILRGHRLLYVSRRGTIVRTHSSGRCLPVDVGLCPKCMWAEAGGRCRSCAMGGGDSVEWTIQCGGGCSGHTRRRLLDSGPSSFVELVVANATAPELAAAFPNATVTAETNGARAVFPDTLQPADTIRAIRAVLAEKPSWVVVSGPMLVYPPSAVVSGSDESSGQRLGALEIGFISAACGIVLVAASLVLFRVYMPGKIETVSESNVLAGVRMDGAP